MNIQFSMKKNYRIFLIGFFSFLGVSTIQSCLKKIAKSRQHFALNANQISRLKEKTVVLILPASEYSYLDDYKELIPTAWTLTPIEVIKYDALRDYSKSPDKYAFFQIDGIETNVTSQSGPSYSTTHYFLTLALVYEEKNKPIMERLCRVELYPEFETVNYSFRKVDVSDQVYRRAVIRNFSLPYILAYLRFVQKNFLQSQNPWIYENYSDETLRGRLANDTLYIPDNLVYDRNKFNGKETKKDESFFKNYTGKYKIVSTKELISMIKNRKNSKPLFLFEYVLSSTDKYVGVLEVNSGTVVQRKYSPVSYNLKPKDLEQINRR